jgi:hypothetical protein
VQHHVFGMHGVDVLAHLSGHGLDKCCRTWIATAGYPRSMTALAAFSLANR